MLNVRIKMVPLATSEGAMRHIYISFYMVKHVSFFFVFGVLDFSACIDINLGVCRVGHPANNKHTHWF